MSITTNDSFLQWDPAQVSNFINSINPDDKFGTLFLENNIEGSLLPFITTDHLKEIGIERLGLRLLIKKKISELINSHYEKNPPKSFNDPEYKLNNININNNYINFESLNLSTVLMKDMIKKVTISLQHHQSQSSSPVENQQLDMKKLNDNFVRLKSDLIPVIRLLKDSKPLPTPTLDPGHGNLANLDSPTYSISSSHSTNSNTLLDSLQDVLHTSQSNSNRNSNPLPSPTQSNRFSSGSLLSLGTGKIAQSNNGSTTMLSNVNNSNTNTIDLNNYTNNSNTSSGSVINPKSRPRLIESKSTSSATTYTQPSMAPKVSRKHSSSTGSTSVSQVPTSSSTQSFANAEPLKQLRASTDDSCLKILQHAMRRHHVPRDDWSKYVLVICYGDKERILKLAEKPVPIFKELQELGKHPAIMLRQLAETTVESNDNDLYEDSRIGDDIPGGTL